MRNRYPGPCYRCGMHVQVGEGHFERVRGKGWRVQHADCAIRWSGKPAPTKAEARSARERSLGEYEPDQRAGFLPCNSSIGS